MTVDTKHTDKKRLSRRLLFQGAAGVAITVFASRTLAQDDGVSPVLRKAVPADNPQCHYPGFAPRTEVVDGIRIDRDVAITLRDGVTIYTDVYRPDGVTTPLPAILSYSPYGKQPTAFPLRGVPAGAVSSMAKGEGPDPAYWCKHGYVVINSDSRGAYKSQGVIHFWGTTDGKDAHDIIEWAAAQPWSNSKVAMSGSSWLAVAQWFAAAERPPHLAAIAPWEGFDDFYRDSLCPGGIPETGFVGLFVNHSCGSDSIEDIPATLKKYPMMNAYWEDKVARVEQIEVPAYVVNTFNHFHSLGTLDGFRRMASNDKWLRVSNQFEWPDYYDPANVEDLRKFFDHYLLGVDNGWQDTPRVRLSVMNPGGPEIINRVEAEWPLKRQSFETLYLDAGSTSLVSKKPSKSSKIAYDSVAGEARFTKRFDTRTEITGHMKLRLWIEAEAADDMDLFVYVRKLDADKVFMPALILGEPHPGSQGWMRASHRALDPVRSTPSEPYQTHKTLQKLKKGEVVPVDIGVWPTAMVWEPGQHIEVLIAGRFMRDKKWFEPFRFDVENSGQHILHTGGKYDAHLLIPVIPA